MSQTESTPDGLKIFRLPTNMEVHRQDRQPLIDAFPDHFFFVQNKMDTNIIRRRESRAILAGSQVAKDLKLEVIAARTLVKGVKSAKKTLSLTPVRLQFVPHPEGSTHRIALFLDDPEAYLEEERNSYLRVLGKLAGKENLPVNGSFVPAIEVGQVHRDSSPSLDALRAIANFIPDQIELNKVRTDPRPLFK